MGVAQTAHIHYVGIAMHVYPPGFTGVHRGDDDAKNNNITNTAFVDIITIY